MIGSVITKRVIRKGYRSLNRRRIEPFMRGWAEDAVFVFPGKVSVSGEKRGRPAIREFFERVLVQFPELEFRIRSLCLQNAFDFVGTNTVAVEWDLEVVNRVGRRCRYSGVTMLHLRLGNVVLGYDYIFDPDILRVSWSEP